jgi:hypothetical protein
LRKEELECDVMASEDEFEDMSLVSHEDWLESGLGCGS